MYHDQQTRIILEFVQRRSEPAETYSLGHFAFGPTLHPRKNYPVEVTTKIETGGLVKITARDGLTGESLSYVLQNDTPLEHTDLDEQRRWIEESLIN